jgi:AcrR family transcriptional regulator
MPEIRSRILEEALDEFAERGLVESSIESIADRAECEPGAVRALFVDKDTLLGELLREKTAPMMSAVGMAVESVENPRELMRKTLQLYDQWLLEHPKVVRLFVRCSLDGADSLRSLYEHTLLPSDFFERMEKIINKGQLRCDNMFMVSLLFDSLIMFPHMMRSLVEIVSPGQSSDKVFQERFDAVVDLLENGLYSQ